MTYATYAALAAGTASKYAAAQKTKSAQEAVQTMESERQGKLRKEAEAALANNISGNEKIQVESDITEQADKRKESLTESLGMNSNEVGVGSKLDQLGVSAGNRLVQTDSAQKGAENAASAAALTNSLSKLGGFGDMVAGRNVANARGLMEQAQLGNFMQGSNSAAGVEMEGAGRAGDNLNMIGDILNTVAMVSSGYAAQGTSPFNTAAQNAEIIAKNQAAATAAAAGVKGAAATGTVTTAGAAAPAVSLGATLLGSLAKKGGGPRSGYIGPYTSSYYDGFNAAANLGKSKEQNKLNV